MAWYFLLIFILFWLYLFDLVVVLILENRDPRTTIAWILALLFLPGVGLIVYFWVGENLTIKFRDWNLRRPKYMKLRFRIVNAQKHFLKSEKLPEEFSHKKHLIYLALQSSDFPFSKSNSVNILNNGTEFFPKLFNEIQKAKDHIHLEYYIVQDDEFTEKFAKLLIDKAKEGVKIRILCDGFGSSAFVKKYKKTMKENNIDLRIFLHMSWTIFRSKLNHRNHRKIAVIDGKVGFIGGMNIGKEYFGGKGMNFWRDLQLKIEGPAVYSLQTIFIRDWFFATRKDIYSTKMYPQIGVKGQSSLLIAPSGPNQKWENSRLILFSMISCAKKRLYLETPYFAPDEPILMAMTSAALKGVDVVLVIPYNPDLSLYKYVNFSYLPELLNAGVKVYAYKKGESGILHTKMVISDDVAAVGSTNLNSRSLKLDFEANVYAFSTDLVNRLAGVFESDLKSSIKITKDTLKEQTKMDKFKQSLTRLLSPLL